MREWYNKYRHRIITSYLRNLRQKVRAAEKAKWPDPIAAAKLHKLQNRFNRLSMVYYSLRLDRSPFVTPRPRRDRKDPNPYQFNGPDIVLEEGDRYGLLPEGWYYLVLDGREYRSAVRMEVDEETATILLRGYA